MNRMKSLQYAVALGQLIAWVDGRFAAERETEAQPELPPALNECRALLADLRQGYGATRKTKP